MNARFELHKTETFPDKIGALLRVQDTRTATKQADVIDLTEQRGRL